MLSKLRDIGSLVLLLRLKFVACTFDCFANRFPLNMGCGDADTEITSVVGSESTFYFGGWTKCSAYKHASAAQGTIIGKSDISTYQWVVHINLPYINGIDHMELHTNLLVFASSTNFADNYFILSIDISDGSLLLQRKLDYTNLEANTVIQNWYKSFFLAESASNIYLTIKTSDNSEMGFMRL